MSAEQQIRPKVRDAILQSVRAGVVPRIGQQHIQVGRVAEVQALIKDIDRVADGGSAVRFVVGSYGSGKTFFLNLIRSIALEKKLVVASADLGPDRRLHASSGQARSLYQELTRNLATRARPEGGAMSSLVERFVTQTLQEARQHGTAPQVLIQDRLQRLTELVGGYDFAEVIGAYWRAHDTGNDQLKAAAIRWLRGEYSTKTDARAALGVRTIVDDTNVYDQLKLLALFTRLSGYGGLLVSLDEMVNLFKLGSGVARKSNYEQVLRILNDCLQGSADGLGFLFGATPELVYDTRRGLYSYEALQSRLAQNRFATGGLVDYSNPLVTLDCLSPEDLFVLLNKLCTIHASANDGVLLIPEQGIVGFLEHCNTRVGEAYFRTPRNTIKAFVDLLEVLAQNPEVRWMDLLPGLQLTADDGVALDQEVEPADEDDELASFRI